MIVVVGLPVGRGMRRYAVTGRVLIMCAVTRGMAVVDIRYGHLACFF